MLVGEYAVVLGGSALSIPFPRFEAKVRKFSELTDDQRLEAEQSRAYLSRLFAYISDLPKHTFHALPDLKLFSSLSDVYWMEMNIPNAYGLGSSGAVSAAIYDLFFPRAGEMSLEHQREDLAVIESYFHGKSSGVDALTCHAKTALYFHSDGSIEKVKFDPLKIPGAYRFFLLDSGVQMDTGPLVKYFMQQMEISGFATSIRYEYLVINQKLINALLNRGDGDPGMLLRVLSDYQYTHFRKMIPDVMLDAWIEGQLTNDYYLKLNGSGGGFMLGIAHETSMDSLNQRWGEQVLWIP